MKLKDIKFIPIFVRYILPFLEIYLFKIVDQVLIFQATNNQIDANDAVKYFKYITCCIFVIGVILFWKYKSKLAFILQLVVLYFLLLYVGLDQSMNYRIPH